jgi:hypothetical protein
MRVVIHDDASRELEEDAAWYEHQEAELGAGLLEEATRALVTISEAPRVWPLSGVATRSVDSTWSDSRIRSSTLFTRTNCAFSHSRVCGRNPAIGEGVAQCLALPAENEWEMTRRSSGHRGRKPRYRRTSNGR